MNRRWIVVVLVAVAVIVARPVRAGHWLYSPSNQVGAVGHPIFPNSPIWEVSDRERALIQGFDAGRVQPDYRYSAQAFPNDPDFPLQWNFSSINIPSAWAADTIDPVAGGDPRVVVAVLDTGLATSAPDLTDMHLWTNAGETPGDGVDNDHDGFVDDVHGWDFMNNDALPADDNGHGTHIVGTIAESTNNSVAATGIAFNSAIMPLKVLDSAGNGSTSTIATAIAYAAAHGANIINLSLGGTQDDPILHQAIQGAANKGIIVVAAAGNSATSTVDYPAAYNEVIGVSATQFDNSRPSYANYGSGLDIMAPGGNSALDQNHDGFADGIFQQTCTTAACSSFSTRAFEGTSQATAHVSGVAALLEACGVPAGQVASTIESTATDLGPAGYDTGFGAGLINAGAALQTFGCPVTTPPPPTAPSDLVVHPAHGLSANLSSNARYAYQHPEFDWSGAAGTTFQVKWQLGSQSPTITQQISTSFSPTVITNGTYTFSVATIDALGQTSNPLQFTYVFRRAALAIGSKNQIRLYDDAIKKIRQFSLPGTQTELSGGQTEADGADRLAVSYPTRPSSMVLMTTKGLVTKRLQPFGQKFFGNIGSATLRSIGGNPQLALVTATAGAEVRMVNPNGQSVARQVLYQTYRSGLSAAAGDIDGDGQDELVIGQIAGPEIRVYSADLTRLSVITPLGRKYSGGWTVAAADENGDGHQDIVAVGGGSNGRRPVYVLTLHGSQLARWTLSTAPYDGPISIVSSDLIGDGLPRLFVVGRSAAFLQQWSVQGNKERQFSISGLSGLQLTSLP